MRKTDKIIQIVLDNSQKIYGLGESGNLYIKTTKETYYDTIVVWDLYIKNPVNDIKS